MIQIEHVQQDDSILHTKTCLVKNHLETWSQLRPGVLLNTSRQARNACRISPPRIVPASVNSRCGDFLLLSRETASCHTVGRNMVGSTSVDAGVRARGDIPIHRPTERRKTSAPFVGLRFSFLSLFMSRTGVLLLSWGSCFCFRLFRFVLTYEAH